MANRTIKPLLPELWVGVECSLNRVRNSYSDQLERTGHALRLTDLDRLAELGVQTIRYPVLWERTAPQDLNLPDWSWSEERLRHLRQLGLKPIVGLLHHGNGPRYTSLCDPDFPEKFATYAGKVAGRYPWITDYSPINEPLTTARFSCLYGHWYPHARDRSLFARVLLNQCRAIILAMLAIRKVNPAARFIQAEDLGKAFSTPKLTYQAEFENERRWLSFDLLCGRLVPESLMWDYLRKVGIEAGELEWFLENSCSPDIVGMNHYITSERFLDDHVDPYPERFRGGNGHHEYADVEAVRVCAEGVAGPKRIMNEAWERYHLPLAFTEAHLSCTREEQLRWINEIWRAAVDLRAGNIDVRAVTAWAAFGAFDWDNLLTVENGSYESGIFDLRSPTPRPTAIATLIRTIASGNEFDHPVLDNPGWWHRSDRLCYPPVSHSQHAVPSSNVRALGKRSRPLLITGATGKLGRAFAFVCEKRALTYELLSRKQLDIADRDSLVTALDRYSPWAIINAAGYARVDDAEANIETCRRENVIGPECLASECAVRKLPLVTFSSDLVFEGLKKMPYVESDVTSPINVYGKSQVDAEERVFAQFPEALVIRTSALFGHWNESNFVREVLDSLSSGRSFVAANDVVISPTYVPDLVNAALDLLIDGERGIWHLANPGTLTWAEFAYLIARKSGYEPTGVHGRPGNSLALIARRPAFTALTSERGNFMPPLEESLDRCLNESNWRSGVVARS